MAERSRRGNNGAVSDLRGGARARLPAPGARGSCRRARRLMSRRRFVAIRGEREIIWRWVQRFRRAMRRSSDQIDEAAAR